MPDVSLFRRFRCYLDRPHAPHGPLRHPSLPGMSLFRRIGSHLRRVTMYPALWQRAPAPDAPLKNGESALRKLGDSELLITVLVRRPSVEHSPSRGTSRCAPGAFSLTAPVFRSSRAQKGAWCAREGAAERQQVETGGGSTYRREQTSASKDKRRCNQRQVAGRRRERTDGAGAGRHHFMPYKKSASADRRGRGTLQRKVGKRLERRRGSGTCPVKKGGPAKRPALLTPGSQVEKSIGFPYVGEETR